MKAFDIYYHHKFTESFQKLPKLIKKKAILAEQKFRRNPLYPSLRTHKLSGQLKGLWCISLDRKYRIIFKPLDKGHFIFYHVGTHAIYEN